MPLGSRYVSVLLLALVAPSAAAHPLHGAAAGFLAGFGHPFLGLDHLLAMLAVGAWAAHLGGPALWRVPLVFAVTLLIGGAAGAGGFSLPYIEPMIAASVLVLGLLVASGRRFGPLPATFLMVTFGLFHGLAHGVEWSPALSMITYVVGFVSATAALHLAGFGAALWLKPWTRLAGAPIALCGGWWLVQLAA